MNILLVNWQDRENPHAGGAEIHLFELFARRERLARCRDIDVGGLPRVEIADDAARNGERMRIIDRVMIGDP